MKDDLLDIRAGIKAGRYVNEATVSQGIGHASVAITLDTYSHMLPGMAGEAADAMGEALG